MLRHLAAYVPLGAIAIPVAIGLLLTIVLAFGITPTSYIPNTQAWQMLLQDSAIWTGVALSLWSAWGSTALAFILAICLGFWIQSSRLGARFLSLIPGLLAIPHAAFAVGFYFLISPSGWVARVLSPWAIAVGAVGS